METDEINKLLNPIIDISTIKIFNAEECIICMNDNSSIIFIPCGH